jgi:hypothetical protein
MTIMGIAAVCQSWLLIHILTSICILFPSKLEIYLEKQPRQPKKKKEKKIVGCKH